MTPFLAYLAAIRKKFAQGNATEETHRGALEHLLEAVGKGVTATNEPKRIACGAPDFNITRNRVPLGHIETKDIGINLDDMERGKGANGEQFYRYRDALPNWILTDYLEFHWFIAGEKRLTARLAEIDDHGRVRALPQGEQQLAQLLESFFTQPALTVGTAKELARHMAGMTRNIRDLINATFAHGAAARKNWLENWLAAFREVLIPDLNEAQFADMFAQTLAYGLFAARVNTPPGKPFSREMAAFSLPKTNPFLRKLFAEFAGVDMPETFDWAVDDIVELLKHAAMDEVLKDFGKGKEKEDPVVHFYETFLTAYDPKTRELRGVYYTPEPVVSYIVRSIDYLLKTRFDRPKGLADENTLILDPATGTATFLYFVIRQIYEQIAGQKGAWDSYVAQHLLSRLFGFELLMAPYAVAHLKLGMELQETGYKFGSDQRLGIYLTNTLEEAAKRSEKLFARWISDEANEAAEIKRDRPILVVLGNPPYSGHSANRSRDADGRLTFIGSLIEDYKRVDGKPLGERNPKWLQDDYVKFIRFAQWRIDRTGYGILGFITNHGYLDNPTFRGMRQQLMQVFDEIYVLDLHGSSKKKERSPDGSKDGNVFDIQQGVAIGIFVKHARNAAVQTVLPEGASEDAGAASGSAAILAASEKTQAGETPALQDAGATPGSAAILAASGETQAGETPALQDAGATPGSAAILAASGETQAGETPALQDAGATPGSAAILAASGETQAGETPALQDAGATPGSAAILAASEKTKVGETLALPGIYHAEVWGPREHKYETLFATGVATTRWSKLSPTSPFYLFIPQDAGLREEYEHGWKITEIMPVGSLGITTARDSLTVHWTGDELLEPLRDFESLPVEEARAKYRLGADARDWKVSLAQKDLQDHGIDFSKVAPILYRPFDSRFTYYTGRTRGLICMPRREVMQHMLAGGNLGLCATRSIEVGRGFEHVFCTARLIQLHTVSLKEVNYLFPLYLQPQQGVRALNQGELAIEAPGSGRVRDGRTPNLNPQFIADIEKRLGLKFGGSAAVPAASSAKASEDAGATSRGSAAIPAASSAKASEDAGATSRGSAAIPAASSAKASEDAGATSRGSAAIPAALRETAGETPALRDAGATSRGSAAIPAAMTIRSRGRLPHWERAGAIYFVTFRLADSLPQSVLESIEFERKDIIKTAEQQRRDLTSAEQDRLNKLFSERVEQYLDAGEGECFLARAEIAKLVTRALQHFDGKRYRLLAWCIMPNHVHVVFEAFFGRALSEILHSWKSYTAKRANKTLERSGEFWQREYYDHLVRDEQDLDRVLQYVGENPAKAGLKDWPWVWTRSAAIPVALTQAGETPALRGAGALTTFGPEDVFDYMYAVFHSPAYRKRYSEFLKSDFPRLPLTSNRALFAALVEKGGELVALHLMESPKLDELITIFPEKGSDVVEKVSYTDNNRRVWINPVQYFEGVPREVWEFRIGGYQVLEKWLKDRKGRELSWDDLQHYQRIVVALKETIRLMNEIDTGIGAHGGFPLQ